jgi:GntR family transcriptional regulator
MFFQIDASNGLAIYDQISRQLKFAVAKRVLRPGELVPSVRELSRQLTVNPNTVARAYRDLQSDGVLEPVRGTGLRVTERAPAQCARERDALLRTRMEAALREALLGGLSADDVKRQVDELLGQLAAQGNGDEA